MTNPDRWRQRAMRGMEEYFAVLVGALYRRLKIAARENWLGTCIRKTWVFVATTVFLLFAGGVLLTLSAPGAQTIGSALEQIIKSTKPR